MGKSYKLHSYIVWASPRARLIVHAKSAQNARERAWNLIKDGYRYGWTRKDFLKNAKVEYAQKGDALRRCIMAGKCKKRSTSKTKKRNRKAKKKAKKNK